MNKTKLLCNNFSGLNRNSSIFSSSVITASDIQNVELYATQKNAGIGIRTSKGNVAVCNLIPDDEEVINIFESIQNSDTYFFVHTESDDEGKIYLYSPANNTLTLKVSDLTVTGKSCATDVAQGWSDLWVFSNSEELLSIEIGHYNSENVLSEVTMMNLTDVDERTIKGMGLVIYAGRLWIFGNQVLWYSVQENIYDFSTSDSEITTSAGYIEFVKKITAIYPYLDCLAVFHADSSCMVAQDESDKSFYKTSDFPGGCASYNALTFHGTQLYFYDDIKKGVFSFVQVVNGDKTLGNNIALDIQNELFSITGLDLSEIRTLSVVTSDRNEVWFLLPHSEENYSTILIYDYLRNTWVKRKSQKINCLAIIGNVFYSAGKKIYKEYSSLKFDGEFIEAYYKCAPLNLGEESVLKILALPPKVTLDMRYNNNFWIEYTKDYNSLTTKLRRVNSKTLYNALEFDKGNWDINIFPYAKNNVIKRIPSSYFKTLQINFYTKNSGDNFCISNIEFGKIKVKN